MSMELKSSSPKTGGLSPRDCVSDPDEKEISDDDDDDRNHKHRRRETQSQSLDRDQLEQATNQPYRKRNRLFENGQNDPQSRYNLARDFSKFENRRPSGVNFSRFSGDRGRGRGRDFQRDLRFGSVDAASQMVHPGSFPSAMLTGRGLPNVSNAQSASWSGFGLIPAIPNGAIDTISPLGLPGILRPQLNPSLNMGIQRQRCRDFEERGFCMRGDMCPMEHGINRIVVEDVQSLSQFNLPGSVSSAHVLGTSAGSGFVPSVSVSSRSLINSRGLHNGSLVGSVNSSGADMYDPDQPLWNNNGHETPMSLLGLQRADFDECESFMGAGLSDQLVRSSGAATGSESTSSSVWGRLNRSKNKLVKPSEYPEIRQKEIREASSGTQGISHLGKQNNGVLFGPKIVGSTSKLQNDVGANVRKPSQKAQRTLFVNCIPLKDNKKENLLSHFKKFGEVIDIYIPVNSERAFVQFSKREEAERALKAPDAVMGSRFIKLWWANRDNIADEGMSSGNNVSITPQYVSAASGSSHLAVVNKGRDNLQSTASKVVVSKPPDGLVTVGNDFKPIAANSPKAPPPVQKKMESLQLLEELRRKQEMLDQKRNEFRQQLDKLAKQSTGVKSDVSAGEAAKRQKMETSTDTVKAGKAKSGDAVVSETLFQTEVLVDKMVNIENLASQGSKVNSAELLDPSSLKQMDRPMATSGTSFHMNRYKLDNRPTAFRIKAPLPGSLANVAALRDHFSLYGAVSNVEIEDSGEEDCHHSEDMRSCSAHVSFATRHSAERAFLNGKSWNGHNLQFIWVNPSIPSTSRSSRESSSALKGTLNAEVQSAEKTTHNNSQDSLAPKESNSSPHKSSNELSADNSRSTGRGNSPATAGGNDSDFEDESPDKSANYNPLEAAEPQIKDCQAQEEDEIGGEDMKSGKDLRANGQPTLFAGEKVA